MKRKLILCMIALTTLLLSGCARNNNEGTNPSYTSDSSTHSATTEVEQTTTHAQNDNDGATKEISEEEAKAIALSHAGFTTDQVTFIKSGIDRDNGRVTYDVEFYTNDHKEYDYDIDLYTGEILDYDYDAEYYTQSTDTPNAAELSADDAKQIALNQVPGATAQDIREFKSDYDNSRLQYEGKIYYGDTEYEFEIDGYDGSILEWDVEPIYNGNL